MKTKLFFISLAGLLLLTGYPVFPQAVKSFEDGDKLVVLWTSDDPYVAETVAFMYTHAAKKNQWFSDVTLIIWGPSAKLITENVKLQDKLKSMQKDGVVTEACIACANMYGVADSLRTLGITVKGMGQPLSEYLKSGARVLTF